MSSRRFTTLFAALSALVALLIAAGGAPPIRMEAAPNGPELRLLGDRLELTVPAGSVETAWDAHASDRLVAEILDPAGGTVCAGESVAPPALKQRWRVALRLPANFTRDDLAWFRLRLRMRRPGAEGGETVNLLPVSELLARPVVRVLGRPEWVAGMPGALRVVVRDSRSGEPLDGEVTARISGPGFPVQERRTRLDAAGMGELAVALPVDAPATARVELSARTAQGVDLVEFDQPVAWPVLLLLSTDKPRYQPGHLVHIRAQAFNRVDRRPLPGRSVRLEAEDARGNRVLLRDLVSDEFGTVWSDLALAETLNSGDWTVRATLGDRDTLAPIVPPADGEDAPAGPAAASAPGSAEAPPARPPVSESRTITVERYILPKFRVEVRTLAGPGGAPKDDFAPGETIHGEVRARYPHGRPLAGARVDLDFSLATGAPMGERAVRANDDGLAVFSWRLPKAKGGEALNRGAATVRIAARVTDGAGRVEGGDAAVLITAHPFLVNALPESGRILPGLPNRVYLVASDPGGAPRRATFEWRTEAVRDDREVPWQAVESDAAGVAEIEVRDEEDHPVERLHLRATDGKQLRAETTVEFEREWPSADVPVARLRAECALCRAGQPVRFEVLSDRTDGPVYLELARAGQTLATRAGALVDGRAEFSIQLDAGMAGTLEAWAFLPGRAGALAARRVVLFADPGALLPLRAIPDKARFRPGETARVALAAGADGEPVPVQFDLAVVDEAVFRTGERRPGFERLLFFLDRAPYAPRAGTPALDPEKLAAPDEREADDNAPLRRARLGQLLSASAAEAEPYRVADHATDPQDGAAALYLQRYLELARARLNRVIAGMNRWYAGGSDSNHDLAADIRDAAEERAIDRADLMDPWNHPYEFSGALTGPDPELTVRMTIPARNATRLEVRLKAERLPGPSGKTLAGREQRVLAPGMAREFIQVGGRVIGAGRQPAAGAAVTLQGGRDGEPYRIKTDAQGRFSLDHLQPDGYRLTVALPGWAPFQMSLDPLAGGQESFVEIAPEPGPAVYRLSIRSLARPAAKPATIRPAPGKSDLTGTVTDARGGPLAGARVVLRNAGGAHVAQTDAQGRYRLPFLIPGVWRLTASAPGLQSLAQDGVRIAANSVTRLDLALAAGNGMVQFSSSETVTVAQAGGRRPATGSGGVTRAAGALNRGETARRLGTLRGRVTDDRGQPLPGAVVRAKGPQGLKGAETDEQGDYAFPYLPPGVYEITVTMDGFNTVVQPEVTVSPRQATTQPFKLSSGGEVVMVSASALRVDSASSTSSTRVNLSQAVEEYARNRDFVSAFDFSPGVVNESGVGGGNPSIGGASGLENQYLISGVNVTNSGYGAAGAGRAPLKLRNFFPETLFVAPALNAPDGTATVEIPLADSITRWRMSLFAVTKDGRIASLAEPLTVFQPLFVDLDVPLGATAGDEIALPAVVSNYDAEKREAVVTLEPGAQFALAEGESAEKRITLAPGGVAAVRYRVRAIAAGPGELTLRAEFGGADGARDGVQRSIPVSPDGAPVTQLDAGIVRPGAGAFWAPGWPADALPEGRELRVRAAGSPVNQLAGGLEAMLRLPTGCLEQTSSALWPDLMILRRLRKGERIDPDVEARARDYIATGYQRLLTFEVAGQGGFSLYGQPPADPRLTAFALLELAELKAVLPVSEPLLVRTRDWLARAQRADGSWPGDALHIEGDARVRAAAGETSALRTTLFAAWALYEAGERGAPLQRAQNWLGTRLDDSLDTYTLALAARFAAARAPRSAWSDHLAGLLAGRVVRGQGLAYWPLERRQWTAFEAYGEAASVETTALVAQALLLHGGHPELAADALGYLLQRRGADGHWGSTQATVQVLRALDLSAGDGGGAGTVIVTVDGVERTRLAGDAGGAMREAVIPLDGAGSAPRIELAAEGGAAAFQLVLTHREAWGARPATTTDPLGLALAWDRGRLALHETATLSVTLSNPGDATLRQPVVEVGLPPGVTPDMEALDGRLGLVAAGGLGHLMRHEWTGDRVRLYFDGLAPHGAIEIPIEMTARFKLKGKTPRSRAWLYYSPDQSTEVRPAKLEVIESAPAR